MPSPTLRLLVALLLFVSSRAALASNAKANDTPCFWQRDPDADFDNDGRNHCAPVAISDGLIYLANARGYDDLVEATDHEGQIALITELAEAMTTDPTEGTNPDKILTGLRSYAKEHGYTFQRLELATWRGVSNENKKYKIAAKPSLSWMTAAAEDRDTIEVFNFGWYKEEPDGRYSRHSGHWVNVIGAERDAPAFELHNPILEPTRQESATSITLTPVDADFTLAQANGGDFNMSGYYEAEGPGLPFNKQNVSAAVLDSVIVFKLKKE